MRLFWWRGKKDKSGEGIHVHDGAGRRAVQVADPPAPIVRDGILLLAQEYLVARGARVRVEQEDVVVGTLPDGTQMRYTTSPAKVADYEDTRLLVAGSAELAGLVDDVAREARLVALSLPAGRSAAELAREAVSGPPASCKRCPAAAGGDGTSPCEACPLRDGRYAFSGLGPVRGARELGAREAWSMEVVFQVVAHDKAGRLDDTVRLALDLDSLTPAPLLTNDAIVGATGEPVPGWALERLDRAAQAAKVRLRPGLAATAAFLSARSRAEFLRRRDEIASTAAALRREPGSDSPAIGRTLAVEMQRLDDIFAVEVDASVASVAFVRTRVVDVALERAGGRALVVGVDTGREYVRPPACGACGEPCRSGDVCREGHIVCPACFAADGERAGCPVCATGTVAHRLSPGVRSADGGSLEEHRLTAAALRALPDAMWCACAGWFLEERGITVDRLTPGDTGVAFQGAKEGRPVFALAMRGEPGWPLGEHDVRRAAAIASGHADALCLLLSPVPASPAARIEAERLGVELWTGAELEAATERAASSYEREREAAADERARRLALARSVRAELVAAMETTEAALSAGDAGPAVSGQRRVVEATRAVQESRGVLLQAFAAWETAAMEYIRAFGERAERDGSLAVVASTDALDSLLDRARHLAAVTEEAARTIARSASKGELGYTAWRRAVAEELVGRCEAVRWRALSVDPAEAGDFALSRDEQASVKAEEAAIAAARAAVRAEAAHAQLGERARL